MTENLKLSHCLFSYLFLCFPFIVSCINDKEEVVFTENEERMEREQKLLEDSIHVDMILDVLCDKDTLEAGSVKYIPKYGKVLDISLPDDYSVGVDSTEVVLKIFMQQILPAGEEDNVKSSVDGTLVYKIDGRGSLTYIPSNAFDLYATIIVDFKEISQMKKIHFIPISLWPHNSNDSTPFVLGSVWRRKSDNEKFICIRECQGGVQGIMVSLVGHWYGLDSWKGRNGVSGSNKTSWIYRLRTNHTTALALHDLCIHHTSRAKKAFEAVGKKLPDKKGRIYYYDTYVSGRKFHWGPSDYHYSIEVGRMRIGRTVDKNIYDCLSYKTCESSHDMRSKEEEYGMSSFEFGYMSTGERNGKYELINK